MPFKITTTLSDEDMMHILSTGFESGSYGSVVIKKYGPDVERVKAEWGGLEPRYSTDPLTTGCIYVTDKYGDGMNGVISYDTLTAGLKYLQEKHPKWFADLVSGGYDVIPADALIQAAAFGEVIYG